MNELISVIIPTYNRAYILNEAINSVVEQTYTNWEIIIIDDGSTDNTKNLIISLSDKRIRYCYQDNKGASAARNKGLDMAKGQWIVYLDSDNKLLSNYLEVMLDNISKTKDVIFSLPKGYRHLELYQDGKMVQRIDETSEFVDNINVKDIINRKFHCDLNGLMHSNKVIKDGIRFDVNLVLMEDWDLLLALCNKYPNNFLYVNELLYTYSQRYGTDGVISNSTYYEYAESFEYIYQKHKNESFMEGQTWYPERVNKWNKLTEDYNNGLIPPYNLFFFKNFWNS